MGSFFSWSLYMNCFKHLDHTATKNNFFCLFSSFFAVFSTQRFNSECQDMPPAAIGMSQEPHSTVTEIFKVI